MAVSMSASTGLLLVFSLGLSFCVGDYKYGYEAAAYEPDFYTNTSALTYDASTGRSR